MRDLVVRGIHHAVGVVPLEHQVEQAGTQPGDLERTARVEFVHLAAQVEIAADDAERVTGAEGAQVEVVHLGLAGPVEIAGELEQLAAQVGAERHLQLATQG